MVLGRLFFLDVWTQKYHCLSLLLKNLLGANEMINSVTFFMSFKRRLRLLNVTGSQVHDTSTGLRGHAFVWPCYLHLPCTAKHGQTSILALS